MTALPIHTFAEGLLGLSALRAGCCHAARQGEEHHGDAHQRVAPHPPCAASGEGQGKQGAGDPFNLAQRALGREPLNLSAAALQLEIPSWLAHSGAGRQEAHGAPGNSLPRARP